VSSGPNGKVTVKPAIEPAANVLFHDGTNARLETLMTDVQDNAMNYDLMINLLKGRFNTLLTAIRGRAT
jgi:flagellar basal body rod protein FlgB